MDCHRVAPELARKVAADDRREKQEAVKAYSAPKPTYTQPARDGKPVTLTRKEKRALLAGMAGKGRDEARAWIESVGRSNLSGIAS